MDKFADYIPLEHREWAEKWEKHLGKRVTVLSHDGTKPICSGHLRVLPKDRAGKIISHFVIGNLAVFWDDVLILDEERN